MNLIPIAALSLEPLAAGEPAKVPKGPKGGKNGKGRPRAWGPVKTIGTLQVRAQLGYRALSLEIRPGLWIVAEIRDGGPSQFGAATDAKEVVTQVLRVTDKTMDTIFPRRVARRQQDAEAAQQRRELERMQQQQQQQRAALPAPAPSASPGPVRRSDARWVDDDQQDDDGEED